MYHYLTTIRAIASAHPDRTAIATRSRSVTYGQLVERVDRLAAGLSEHGIGEGAVVAIMLWNSVEWVEAFLASLALGAVPTNINPRYRSSEIRSVLQDCRARALVFHESMSAQALGAVEGLDTVNISVGGASGVPFEQLASSAAHPVREPDPDDYIILYTGGTTGAPKGVIWGIEEHYIQLLQIIKPEELPPTAEEAVDIRPYPAALPGSPLAHPTALGLSLTTLVGGGKLVFSEKQGFDADDCLQLIMDEHVLILGIVGDTFSKPLVDALRRLPAGGRPTHMLAISSSGQFWGAETRRDLSELLPGVLLLDNYGSTEGAVTRGRADDPTFLPRSNVIVVDDELKRLPASGGVGMIAVSGYLPRGYLNDPERTARTFVQVDGVRYLKSGDYAELLPNGRIRLLGRGSGTINTGGEKVWPEEVETALRTHPAVVDAVVVGRPDDRWGSRVTALVTLAPGRTPSDEELYEHCRAQLAGFKCPKEWIRIDAIPRTIAGKPDYSAISELLESQDAD